MQGHHELQVTSGAMGLHMLEGRALAKARRQQNII